MLQRFLFYTALLFFSLLGVQNELLAQTKECNREDQINVQKIAFFTEKLNLTPEEAQSFWPVYNEYWKKKNKIIENRKDLMKQCSGEIDKISASEIENCADKYINSHRLESDLLQEFNRKFKKILPVEKVMKLYFADHEFKTYLLQQIRNSAKKEE